MSTLSKPASISRSILCDRCRGHCSNSSSFLSAFFTTTKRQNLDVANNNYKYNNNSNGNHDSSDDNVCAQSQEANRQDRKSYSISTYKPLLPAVPIQLPGAVSYNAPLIGKGTDLTPAMVWESMTDRLLHKQGDDAVLDMSHSSHRYQAMQALYWWTARDQPLTQRSVEVVWDLYNMITDYNALVKDCDAKNPEALHESKKILHTALDHWRRCIQAGVAVTPSYRFGQIWDLVKNLGRPIDNKTAVLLLSGLAHSQRENPIHATVILDHLLQQGGQPFNNHNEEETRPCIQVWNAVLTVSAKKADWPNAVSQALNVFYKLAHQAASNKQVDPSINPPQAELSFLKPNAVTYACVLQALAASVSASKSSQNGELFREAESIYSQMPTDCRSGPAYLAMLQLYTENDDDGLPKAHNMLEGIVHNYFQSLENSNCGGVPAPMTNAISPTPSMFSILMNGYAQKGLIEPIVTLWRDMEHCAERRMQFATTGSESPVKGEDEAKETESDQLNPTAAVLNPLLQAVGRHNPENSEEILREWEHVADTTSYNFVLQAWAEQRGAEKNELLRRAVALFEAVPRPDAFTFTALMKAHARSRLPDAPAECERILQRMWLMYNDGYQQAVPTTVTYSTVIFAWSLSRLPMSATRARAVYRDWLDRFNSGIYPSLHPTEGLYLILMRVWNQFSASSASNKAYGATQTRYYFDELLRHCEAGDDRLQPSLDVYHALLQSFHISGDAQAAELLLDKLRRESLCNKNDLCKPKLETYHFVLKAWLVRAATDRHAAQRAESYVNRMQKWADASNDILDCRPNSSTFALLFKIWSRSRQPDAPERLEAILRWMEQAGTFANENSNSSNLVPNSKFYDIVLDSWVESTRTDAPDRAQAILDEMLRRYQDGDDNLRPSAAAHTALLNTWGRSTRIDAPQRVLAILNGMHHRHLAFPDKYARPTTAQYVMAMNIFAEHGDVNNAKLLVKRAEESSLHLQANCYNIYIKAIRRAAGNLVGTQAEKVLRDMCRFVPPDDITYTSVIAAYGQQTDDPQTMERARALLHEIVDHKSIQPTIQTFTAYLRLVALIPANLLLPARKEVLAKECLDLMNKVGLHQISSVLLLVEKCSCRSDLAGEIVTSHGD